MFKLSRIGEFDICWVLGINVFLELESSYFQLCLMGSLYSTVVSRKEQCFVGWLVVDKTQDWIDAIVIEYCLEGIFQKRDELKQYDYFLSSQEISGLDPSIAVTMFVPNIVGLLMQQLIVCGDTTNSKLKSVYVIVNNKEITKVFFGAKCSQ